MAFCASNRIGHLLLWVEKSFRRDEPPTFQYISMNCKIKPALDMHPWRLPRYKLTLGTSVHYTSIRINVASFNLIVEDRI